MLVRRVTVNGRSFVLVDPTTAAQMLAEIEAAAAGTPAWVTIPVRETHPPRVLVTPNVDCYLEIVDIPDEDPDLDGSAIAFDLDWPGTL
jgi:hypothetical protein